MKIYAQFILKLEVCQPQKKSECQLCCLPIMLLLKVTSEIAKSAK